MLVACWSVKGGCGTSVVAAMLALALGRWSASAVGGAGAGAPLLVDLTGDLPAVLGLPPAATPGVHEWMHAAGGNGNVGADALGRLVQPLDGLRFLSRGERRPPPDGGDRLVDALETVAAGDVAVADCGRAASSPADALVDGASMSLLVMRPCYLALGRALDASMRASAVLLVDEPGRALGAAEIEDALGVPVVASIRARPSVARAVDAGLLTWRPSRRLARTLAGVVDA